MDETQSEYEPNQEPEPAPKKDYLFGIGMICSTLIILTSLYFYNEKAIRDKQAADSAPQKDGQQITLKNAEAEIKWVAEIRKRALAASDECLKRGGSPTFAPLGVSCQEKK